jgi:hypothetical protein
MWKRRAANHNRSTLFAELSAIEAPWPIEDIANYYNNMASLTKVMSFTHLYDDHAHNPLGTTEEEIAEAYHVIYTAWRTSDKTPMVEIMEEEIISDFVLPIGAVGMFIAEEESPTCQLKLRHGFDQFACTAGHVNPDCRVDFCFEGDVDGTDIFTVLFDPNQHGVTPYVNKAQTGGRHLTLPEAEPTNPMVAPFRAEDAGVRTIRTRTTTPPERHS